MAARIARRLFLSWCHDDEEAKDALLAVLEPNLRILNGVDLRWWEDSHIRIGADWRREILGRLAECDYGLLLLSPGFFASEFIATNELPYFIGPEAPKGALPVGLDRVPLDGSRDLRGVDRYQIFTGCGRWFLSETRGPGRRRFAQDLASALRDRILADA